MPQLHCYLPDKEAKALKLRAELAGMSLSGYLAELARKDLLTAWPPGYFERLYAGEDIAPIERSAPTAFEDRVQIE